MSMIALECMPSKKTEQINIRISEEDKAELAAIAADEHRTISGLISFIVLKWLQDRRKFRESLDETSPKDR